jgi:hypothetical protein
MVSVRKNNGKDFEAKQAAKFQKQAAKFQKPTAPAKKDRKPEAAPAKKDRKLDAAPAPAADTATPAQAADTATPTQAADGAAPTDTIPFEDAVREGELVIARFEGGVRDANMRWGEIAAKCEPVYGKNTLDELGKKLEAKLADKEWASVFAEKALEGDGASDCTLTRTLARNRSVYLAWDGDGKKAPGPISWAVLRVLQSHPDRLELVNDNPHMTKAEARELMQKYKDEGDGDAPDDDADGDAEGNEDQKRKKKKTKQQKKKKGGKDETRKFFKAVFIHANEAEDFWTGYPSDPDLVRQQMSTKSLVDVRRACVAWLRIYKRLKHDTGYRATDIAIHYREEEAESTATQAQATSNGNDHDPAESAEDRKAIYADEDADATATAEAI